MTLTSLRVKATSLPRISADSRGLIHSELTEKIIGIFYEVYNELGHGFLESVYEQALAIDREIGDRRGEGADLWNMSLALDKLGQRREAIEYAEAALKIKEQIEDPRADKVRSQLEKWKRQV